MLFEATRLGHGRSSSSFGRSLLLVGSVFVAGLLIVRIGTVLVQSTFWLGGKHITLNPWYSTLLVDLFFIVFGTGLAQYAETKRDESHSARSGTRAACIACFVVSAATIAP